MDFVYSFNDVNGGTRYSTLNVRTVLVPIVLKYTLYSGVLGSITRVRASCAINSTPAYYDLQYDSK